MNDPKTLLVSQNVSLIAAARDAISSTRGFGLEVVPDIDAACNRTLAHDRVLVILVHLDGTTNVSGLTRILQAVALTGRPVATIVICEQANPEQSLAMTRLGVAECLTRPLDIGRLSYLIDSLTIEARFAMRPVPALRTDESEVLSLGDESPFLFVANSRMGRMVEQIKRIAPLETSVMIGGETGTGKTHLAGVIHRLSPRRDEPFLTINCGALAANLIESEMFGHVRGAFTGADAERDGQVRGGRTRHAVPGRDRLAAGGAPGRSCCGWSRSGSFEPVGSNKTNAAAGPADRGQQPAARAGGRRRPVPGRPVLPVQRGRLRDPPLRDRVS